MCSRSKKKQTLKSMRENPLYIDSLILHGNGKLLDFDDDEKDIHIRYAQFNTRALADCPFASAGCKKICYATKGNHMFPSVIESREKSYLATRREDFAEGMIFTIKAEKQSKRYAGKEMRVRIHESGDFYSIQYLRKWIMIWHAFHFGDGVAFTLYTKSFPFFLMLTEDELNIIREAMNAGILAINLSVDDTTTPEQWKNAFAVHRLLPKTNFYRVTKDYKETDDICDCADCAKCGACNKATGKEKVVKIHSASADDVKAYDANTTNKPAEA